MYGGFWSRPFAAKHSNVGMGKKKSRQSSGLGHAVIKDRFKGIHATSHGDRSVVSAILLDALESGRDWVALQAHTSELDDGYDWGRLGGVSITEQVRCWPSMPTPLLTTAIVPGIECLG